MIPTFDDLVAEATGLIDLARGGGHRIVTAESCTGGLIAAILTEIPGCSDVFDSGFVTYSNRSKCELLGVPPDFIDTHGAVSEEVALSMALGALARSEADIGLAVTGVAGPGGGSPEKPVGTVHVVVVRRDGTRLQTKLQMQGVSRAAVRRASAASAFSLVRILIRDAQPNAPG